MILEDMFLSDADVVVVTSRKATVCAWEKKPKQAL